MQSILIGSFTVGLLVACNSNTGTTINEDSKPTAADPAQSGNLDKVEVGRATRDTDVTFNVSGLSAWAAGDSLQLVDPARGAAMAGIENAFSAYPRGGETTVAGQRLNWRHTGAPLVEAARGESVMLTQLVAAPAGGYSALARAGAAHGFTVRDGEAAALSATLAAVAQDRALTLRFRGDQFAALAAAAGEGARPGGAAAVEISAVLGGAAGDLHAAFQAGLPSLVTFAPLAAAAAERSVVYGNPWKGGEVATALYSASVPVPTRWGVGSALARFVSSAPVTSLKAGELAPQLSPVRGVKLSPSRLSWEAPAQGKATGYSVVVHLVDGSDQGVNLKPLATLTTKATSLALPAEVVTAGRTYVFTITAMTGDGLSFASADHVTAQLAL